MERVLKNGLEGGRPLLVTELSGEADEYLEPEWTQWKREKLGRIGEKTDIG